MSKFSYNFSWYNLEDLIRTLQNDILSCLGPDKVCLLIIDKLPVEFFFLIPLLQLGISSCLETTNSFIHLKGISSQFTFLYIFNHEYQVASWLL